MKRTIDGWVQRRFAKARVLSASRSTSGNWILGMPFALFGAAALVQCVQTHHPGEMAIPALFFLVGTGLMLVRYDLRLDLDHSTYRASRGIWPFVKVRRGSFSEFRGLAVRCRATGFPSYEVVLCWRAPGARPMSLFSPRKLTRSGAFELAQAASERSHIPFLGEFPIRS